MSDDKAPFNLEDLRLTPEMKAEMEKRYREQARSRDRMLQFFVYEHLPAHLGEASAPFCWLAEQVATKFPQNPERTVCLRKLLEAKDAAVRTLLYQEP